MDNPEIWVDPHPCATCGLLHPNYADSDITAFFLDLGMPQEVIDRANARSHQEYVPPPPSQGGRPPKYRNEEERRAANARRVREWRAKHRED